jgi:hypothetical protein
MVLALEALGAPGGNYGLLRTAGIGTEAKA